VTGEEFDIDEEAAPQKAVPVLGRALEADGTGGGVDFRADRGEFAGEDFLREGVA